MDQLNRLYCAQSHLQERLSEVVDLAAFEDLSSYIKVTIEEISLQVNEIAKVFHILNSDHTFEKCDDMVSSLESDFNKISKNADITRSRDLALLNYIQNIQNYISAAFQMYELKNLFIDSRLQEIMSRNSAVEPAQVLKQLLLHRLHQH